MFRDVWTKTLWDHRRALLGWAIGLVAVTLVYGGFYPFMADPAYSDLLETLPAGLVQAMGWEDFSSAEGYMGAAVFGVLGQALIVIFGVSLGARILAGDEDSGSLELVIAHPVSRTGLFLQRAWSLTVAMAMAGLAVFVAIALLSEPIDLGIPIPNLAAASGQFALLGLVFGVLALALGGIVGRYGVVIATTAGIAVISYLADTVAPMVEDLEWVENLSPFDWYDATGILREGAILGDAFLSIAVALVLLVIGVFAFQRRDIGT